VSPTPQLDRHRSRLAVGARVFGVAAVLMLAIGARSPTGVAGALLLGGVALLATLVSRNSSVNLGLVALVETVAAAAIVGGQLVEFPHGAVYLVAPPFIAGLTTGLFATAASCLIQLATVALVTAPTLRLDLLAYRIEVVAPWFVASVGSGLVGAWLRRIEPAPAPDDDAYYSARRLLAELRTVARSLSAGLDPVGIAHQILVEVRDTVGAEATVVLVRTEGGILLPLSTDESDRLSDVGSDEPVVMECWTTEAPAQQIVAGRPDRRALVAVPLQVGVRMTGVVVAQCSSAVPAAALSELRARLSDHALRLDTALLFDEVRTLATADERRRLAREIHDGIAQEVASIGYLVDDLIADSESAEQRECLQTLRQELTRLVNELRLSIFDLRSEVSHSAGISSALSDYVRQVGTRSGMTVHLSLNETPQRLRVEVETEILRIAQEAITNARRHSGASNLWVTFLADPPEANLTIADDGHGLGVSREDSYGLRIMRERAQRIGASLTIQERTGGGTEVCLLVRPERSSPSGPASAALAAQRKDSADAYVGSSH